MEELFADIRSMRGVGSYTVCVMSVSQVHSLTRESRSNTYRHHGALSKGKR
jgi:hypothetical protein